MTAVLPIGVMIPTRNCASLIPTHLSTLQPLLNLVAEVVVVDSDSTDGTVDLLRAGLAHPNVRFLNHPPGLYQSWNHGLKNIRSPYVYISTVGDSITPSGLIHLHENAQRLGVDAVVSRPRLVDEGGAALPDGRWPMDDALRRLSLTAPRTLTPVQQFLFAVTNLSGAFIGSSASNLYRTACLQARPFSADYGIAGDCAWLIENVFEVSVALSPERCSVFRFHRKAYAPQDYEVTAPALKFLRLAQTVVRARAPQELLLAARWDELEPLLETALTAHYELEALRHHSVPWFFHPTAWRARARRNRAESRIESIKTQVLGALS
ncbi:MAG TPA: glycosyltransferase family A protein [Verrucomicrobiae bacterium]|jgi:glycosyltransferase involved in cell wall biosynthesis|nr:glycosyltransferase family A protein [Verrucomicrobiae bacterium]